MTPDPSEPAGAEADRQQAVFDQIMEQATIAAHVHIVAVARLAQLPADLVPRLAVRAACRQLEVLVEAYYKRLQESHGHGTIMYHQEKKDRQAVIVESCADLMAALDEGRIAAEKMRLSLLPKENRQ